MKATNEVITMQKMWHKHLLRVHYKATDQMGVVHHANYISWFEMGRTEMMRHLGIAYRDMEALGLLLPVLDVKVKYHKPAHYDDCVAVYTTLTEFSPIRLTFNYEIRRVSEGECQHHENEQLTEPEGELLTSGQTVHMWLNNKWKPARLNKVAPEVYDELKKIVAIKK